MKLVIRIVNSILAYALNHRQFKQFLLEMNSEYDDLLLYNKVRWLSKGNTLKQFASLLPEIKAFLHEKGILNILNYWTISVHKIYSSWLTHQFNLNRGSYFIRKEIITFYSKH